MFDIKEASGWVRLALELGAEAAGRVGEMSQQKGAEVVERRDQASGSYRYWDPETLRVDKELEDYFIEQLAEKGIDAVVLSEEVGSKKIEPRCAPEVELDRPIYFVSDPFDGSLLYKRNIPAFWFSALAIYTRPPKAELAEPLAAVVVDCYGSEVVFCDTRHSYLGRLGKKGPENVELVKPNDTGELSEAFLETYLMKPHYLYPAAEKFKFLFRDVKFILPNGGPAGFCDVASGKVDVYFAHKQPHTDIFPGIAIAERAGCRVSTFEGLKVNFSEKVDTRYNIICSANETLHDKVLDLLKSNGITDRSGMEEE
jgi:fructose-1,6-bisphosphatase/inositol monophosphatase family enzyme